MSHHKNTLPGPSLAQHFDAPDNYIGTFGWLCGYSADAVFLNNAAERFTRQTSAQRAYSGQVALGVLLDPGNPAITLLDTPGVAHCPINNVAQKPFRLLHAKVALLGFRHETNSDRWCLRLIVSTGNWTRQTLEESLDLVWRLDIDSESLTKSGSKTLQACADIKAAHNFFQWLEGHFDTRLLSAAASIEFTATQYARAQLDNWLNLCSRKAQGPTRFFDNRKKSLQAQLPEKINACGTVRACNYFAMGSGFYETTAEQNALPSVPTAIISDLKNSGLLTKNCNTNLFVNPQACQSIATSATALSELGITIRPAQQPERVFSTGQARSLHAKFLFSANVRTDTNTCYDAWVYLGSGNLTHPGFARKMSANEGNLEAGVVFSPKHLYWEAQSGIELSQVVTNLLPIQWHTSFEEHHIQLQPGAGMTPRDSNYTAPPFAWLNWHAEDNTLQPPEAVNSDFAVLNAAGSACLRTETGYLWPDQQPRQVRCRWNSADQQHECDLPVIDQYGRIAATALPSIGLDEVLWQLSDFLLPLSKDDDNADIDQDVSDGYDDQHSPRTPSGNSSYPIRQMMELIEGIARQQTEIAKMDWQLWCLRLEQTLAQAKHCPAIEAFQTLGLNPISPLWHAAFRPAYAETDSSEEGRIYERVLRNIEKIWGVNHLAAIGEQS